MGATYRKLLEHLIEVRDARYSSDPDRQEAVNEMTLYVLQTILEKLSENEP